VALPSDKCILRAARKTQLALGADFGFWHKCEVPCRPRRAMSEFGGKAEDIYSG
jgi:hypothetical protein